MPSFSHQVYSSYNFHRYRKKRVKKHLSPSRRRALRWFFVQTIRVVQSRLQARPAVGLHGVMVIARCERFCKGVQWTVQMTVHNASTPAVNLFGKYEQKHNKIYDLRGFANGDWSFIRAHNPLVVGSSPTGPTNSKAAHCAAFVFLDGPPQIQSESPRPNVSKTDALDELLAGSWLLAMSPMQTSNSTGPHIKDCLHLSHRL